MSGKIFGHVLFMKAGLSLSEKNFMCFNERPLKVMKNACLFHLQFRSQ